MNRLIGKLLDQLINDHLLQVVTTNELQHRRCVEECEKDGNTQRDADFCKCIEGRGW